ncbi:nicotinamide-nucleotide amidase [Methylomagnum ishizawai]|uniref:Nicotinamide-nucleotide amidase n=1 Tax=Methylomagnum ishizawai TaxID=1760988 RepID=A0A1Y6CZ84_9GAMM|nr:nicotinamide-nucleotide amidase [Methylomagnum ishizawai]SMF95999.1 nicotinamide-nucleotide amidase [Methylomagnum ishizawai]
MNDEGLYGLARQVGAALDAAGWMLATAESCTGGGVAACVTDVAGSSAWFDRGFVTYSNEAKIDMLGVDPETLREHGAVSEATVREMVEGAVRLSWANIAVAVSGIAGPGGGSPDKPVGLVWFAWARDGRETVARCERFEGDRRAVRGQAVAVALRGVLDACGE